MDWSWRSATNRGLRRVGYEVVRARQSGAASGAASGTVPAGGDRLLTGPVFLLAPVRSGSTLLRMILDTHSRLHAPHELHLRDLKVELGSDYVAKAMAELGLDEHELRCLLWDRVLHRTLLHSGKKTIVSKSPDDVFMWRRIAGCWRDARFIFLVRDPGAIVRSWWRARPRYSEDEAVDSVLNYATTLEEARGELPGPTVRYEDLVDRPEATVRELCDFLGVEWEPQMLEYGQVEGRTFKAGLGDWSARIKSGRVQRVDAAPVEIPAGLRKIAKQWGYL